MLKVGITGGIGSGKSTVCNLFRNLGVPIFSSDEIGRSILNNNEEVKQKVIILFGRDMYQNDGTIDRFRMGKLVFSDPQALEQISKIVHPLVQEQFELFCIKNESHSYILKEAAILFESGYFHDLNKIINVSAPKEERIKRVIERDKGIKEDVLKRMRFQYSDEERNKLADFILLNEDKEEILPQVMELHEIFINET
jgi:dephospho-CoA kinase